MFIEEIELSGYVPFMSNELDVLKVNFTSPLQIVIGTNGSGKTSLVKQCTPETPDRSIFTYKGVGGYRILRVSHRGSEYVLTSDFSKSTGAHSITKDGVELNVSGTTSVQDELVTAEFGLTPVVKSLIANKYKFANMTAGNRRMLIMEISPYQLGFIWDAHKKAASRVKGCKSILTRLTERKILLEGKLLAPELIAEMQAERETLATDIASYIGYEAQVSTLLAEISPVESRFKSVAEVTAYAEQIQRSVEVKILRKLRGLAYTTEPEMQAAINELSAQIAALDGELTAKSAELESLAHEQRLLGAKLSDLTDADAEDDCQFRVGILAKRYAELKCIVVERPIQTEEEIKEIEAMIPKIIILLQRVSLHTVFIPRFRIAQKRELYQRARNRLDFYVKELHAKEEALQQVKMPAVTLDQIPTNCGKNSCPLYKRLITHTGIMDETRDKLTAQIGVFTRKIDRLNAYVEGQGFQLQSLVDLEEALNEFSQIEGQIPHLKYLMRGRDVLHVLKTNPMLIVQLLEKHIAESRQVLERAQVLSDLRAEEAKIEQKESIGEKEREILQARFDAQHAKQIGLISYTHTLELKIKELTSEKTKHTLAIQGFSLLGKGVAECNNFLENQRAVYSDRLYRKTLSILRDLKQNSVSRLSQIDSALREQETIRSRYEEEIVAEIETVEAEKKEWEVMEQALARIPYRYSVTFLNNVFGIMNAFISKVFTYPFKVSTLSANSPLNYRFEVKNKGSKLPDMSDGSDAQVEMLNLAFNLAVRYQLKLLDYPIHLDEVGRTFDPLHKQKLLDLLRYLIDNGIVSQMFLINHHAAIHEGLTNSETLVLDPSNVMVPEIHNQHATFNGV